LSYVISNRQTGVVETGDFNVDMAIQERTEERDLRLTESLTHCEGVRGIINSLRTKIYQGKDGYYYNEKVGVRPDGSMR
jgi:hypothetical protein